MFDRKLEETMSNSNRHCLETVAEYEALSQAVDKLRGSLSFAEYTRIVDTDMDIGGGVDASFMRWLYSAAQTPLYVLLMLASLVGNALVILIVALNSRMRHKPTNCLMLNLAVCDLAIVATCMSVQTMHSLSKYWPLGELFCKLNSYLQVASLLATVLTLMAIACDRFAAIVYPLRWRLTHRQALCCIGLVWTVSLTFAVPSYVYRIYVERHWSDFVETHCAELGWPVELGPADGDECPRPMRPTKRLYHMTLIGLLFFMPVAVMSVSYGLITVKMWCTKRVGESHYLHDMHLKRRKRVSIYYILIGQLVK